MTSPGATRHPLPRTPERVRKERDPSLRTHFSGFNTQTIINQPMRRAV